LRHRVPGVGRPVRHRPGHGRPLPALRPAAGYRRGRRPPGGATTTMTTPTTSAPPGARAPAPSATRGRRPRQGSGRGEGGVLVYLVALLVVGLTLGPVLYAVLGGFRTNAQLASDPAGLPDPWVTDNYLRVLTGEAFWTYAVNS